MKENNEKKERISRLYNYKNSIGVVLRENPAFVVPSHSILFPFEQKIRKKKKLKSLRNPFLICRFIVGAARRIGGRRSTISSKFLPRLPALPIGQTNDRQRDRQARTILSAICKIFQRSLQKTLKPLLKSLTIIKNYRATIVPLVITFIILFTLTRALEAKREAANLSQEIRSHLMSSYNLIEAGDLSAAMQETEIAGAKIKSLKLLTQSWGQDIKYLSLAPTRSRLSAFEQYLDSVYTLLQSVSSLKGDIINSFGDDIYDLNLTQFSQETNQSLLKAKLEIEKSRLSLLKARQSLTFPESEKALAFIDQSLKSLDLGLTVTKALPWFSNKRILLLFQNNTELRGSGGFLGSYAVADFSNSSLKSLDFQTNIAKLDKAFAAKTKIPPPLELLFLTSAWGLRDANFAIDFAEGSSKIKEFYTLETGEKANGIIALDTTLFLELLKIVGPIELPAYNKTISEKNFLSDVQYEVEKGYFERPGNKEENEPKEILAEMMPKFIDRLFGALRDGKKTAAILSALANALKEKHLLLNFESELSQSIVEANNWGGRVEHILTDFLFIHNTNIGGMKSSLSVKEDLKHKIKIEEDGRINSTLEITRTHYGNNVWPDGNNKNLVRVLLPQNSKVNNFSTLLGNFWPFAEEKNKKDAFYFEDEEAGKTRVSWWQNTEPGASSKSLLEYKPNYRLDVSAKGFCYNLRMQKQAGAPADDYRLEINYPSTFTPDNIKNFDAINRQIVIRDRINQDKEFSVCFNKKE